MAILLFQGLLSQEDSGLPAGGKPVSGGGDQPEHRCRGGLTQESTGHKRSLAWSASSFSLLASNAKVSAPEEWTRLLEGLSNLKNADREGKNIVMRSDHGAACSPVSQALGRIGVWMSPLECLGCSRGSL